jgi:integrase/recombinase XerD
MIGDKIEVSTEALQELLILGITVQDIEDIMRRKWGRTLDEHRISNRIPAKEAFSVFLANATTSNGHRKGLSPSSIGEYERILWDFYNYCVQCGGPDLEAKDIPQYAVPFLVERHEERNFAVATWNKYAAILRRFLLDTSYHYIMRPGHLPEFKPLREKLPQALSPNEVQQLLRIAMSAKYGLRVLFMVSFFLGTGVRRDEFRLLRRKDIDLTAREVLIDGKCGKQRMISLPDRLVPMTETYFQIYGIQRPMDYVYPQIGHPSRPVSASTLDTTARRLFQKMSTYIKGDDTKGYHLHSLRHTFATHLVLSGVSLRAVAAALGHASVNTTMIYTKLDVRQLREQLRPGYDAMEQWWRVIP